VSDGTTWQESDLEAIAALLPTGLTEEGGWAPPESVTPNWHGTAEQNDGFTVDPQPTLDAARPTMFLVWAIKYDPDSLVGTYDPETAPYRAGELILGVYTEPKAKTGKTARVFRQLRELIRDGDTGDLVISYDLGVPIPMGIQGDYYLEALRLPFAGG
jgi:hypothetical protein